MKHSKNWKEENDQLIAEFMFKDFNEAFSFMTAAALEAEKMDHHPYWGNVYNKVWINLSTHSAGNKITAKDTKLAEVIDTIFKRYA